MLPWCQTRYDGTDLGAPYQLWCPRNSGDTIPLWLSTLRLSDVLLKVALETQAMRYAGPLVLWPSSTRQCIIIELVRSTVSCPMRSRVTPEEVIPMLQGLLQLDRYLGFDLVSAGCGLAGLYLLGNRNRYGFLL